MTGDGEPTVDTRNAYLYARHRYHNDTEAAAFVEWWQKHSSLSLADAYLAWMDEVENIALWERGL